MRSFPLFPSTSLMFSSPLKRIDLWPALEQVLLFGSGFFLGHLGLLCGECLGLDDLFYRKRGVDGFMFSVQIEQARSPIRADHERHHGVTVRVLIVWRFRKRE